MQSLFHQLISSFESISEGIYNWSVHDRITIRSVKMYELAKYEKALLCMENYFCDSQKK